VTQAVLARPVVFSAVHPSAEVQVLFRNYIGTPKPTELLSMDLKATDAQQIPFDSKLMVAYLGMFLCAEAAFTLMAMKEYLQDLLHISEAALIVRKFDPPAPDIGHDSKMVDEAAAPN